MTGSPPPLPPPLPPAHPFLEEEQTALRILELKNQMKSLEVAALLAIFVPVFGGFYASKETGFGTLAAMIILVPFASVGKPIWLVPVVIAYIVSIFSAVKRARLHNEEVIKEARQRLAFPDMPLTDADGFES